MRSRRRPGSIVEAAHSLQTEADGEQSRRRGSLARRRVPASAGTTDLARSFAWFGCAAPPRQAAGPPALLRPPAKAIEIKIDDRGRVERQHLGDEETADDRDA